MGYPSTYEAIMERLQASIAEAAERNRSQQESENGSKVVQVGITESDVKRILEDVQKSLLPADLIAYLATDAGKQQIYYRDKYQSEKNKSESLASKIDALGSDKIELNKEIEALEKMTSSLEQKNKKLLSVSEKLRVQLAKQKLEYDSKSLECRRIEREFRSKLEAAEKESERKLELARGQSVDDISRWQTAMSNVSKKK